MSRPSCDQATSRRLLVAAYLTTAALDTCMSAGDRDDWQARRRLTKPLLMPLLALSGPGQPALLTVAQVSSWAGDVALLRDDDDRSFRIGTGAFAATHLAYAAAISSRARATQPSRRAAVGVAALSSLAAARARHDARRARPALAGAAGAYGLVIGAMATTAALLPAHERGCREIRTGASLFVLSDLLIGATTFTAPHAPRWTEAAVMSTYTAGQLLLALGVRRLAGSGPVRG